MVFGTRHKSQTGLRVRNLETGAERWLAYPVTRDDQESRASRDTLPRYDFMPDGKSLIVPVNGKLQRIDFATGEATPIPFTAKVEAEIAPRVYTPVRVDDGAVGARAADPLAIALAGWIEAGVQRDESPLRAGLSERHAATADQLDAAGARVPKVNSCRRGRRTDARLST